MTHEEADIIMAYNMIDVSVRVHSPIRVVSDDTDVLSITMHQLQARAYNLPATVLKAKLSEISSDTHQLHYTPKQHFII